jgi:hypothetical protein
MDWQAAAGQDAHSWAVDPQFVDDTDLHLSAAGGASAIENAGVVLSEVTDDIDADVRDALSPDIGADELHCHAALPAETCDDSNPCTADTCSSVSGCLHTPLTPPPEAQGMAASADRVTLTWSPVSGATRYDAVRGEIASLPVGPGSGDETCFDDLAGPTLTDASLPGAGSGYWYLVRGENACATGTYGTRRDGTPRVTATCP